MNIRFNQNIFFLLAFPSLFSGANAYSNVLLADEGGIKDEWIVVMKEPKLSMSGGMRNRKLEDFSLQAAESIASSVPGVKLMSSYSSAVRGFSAKMTKTAANEMAKRKDVAFVEQNAIVKASATWGIDRVDQRDLPLDDSFSPSGNGSGVTAYIIDTGIRTTHEDFGERATWGINTSGDNQDEDCNGHGTHVAGTVGGTTYGVAKEVSLVAVKVLTCSGSGSTAGVIAGVEWAMNDAVGKTATANLSLGGGASSAMDTAVRNLHNSGVPTVVAAGNSNTNACNASPAREPAVITVGSTMSNDARSGFSNYGSCLDIFAPGSGITAAWIGDDSDYNTISGTSMASPHVCGGAALLLSNGILATDVAGELESRATSGKVTNSGSQSPNKLLYVAEIGPTNAPTPAPPTPAPTPCISESLKISINTDNYPLETSWKLVNKCNGVEELSQAAGFYSSANTEYESEECVPAAEYTFEIADSYGDGICCSYGSGSYSIEYNGVEVAAGGEFGQSQSTSFGTCNANPTPVTIDPTLAPTSPPTLAPTSPPTSAPTPPPTLAPTSPPTLAPTSPPTLAPTVAPIPSVPQPTSDGCNDDPIGWYDRDGPRYNCAWYAVGNRCEVYGNYYENQGKVANEACCGCGGGLAGPPPPQCTDYPENWYDIDGSYFNCAWYAVGNRCEVYGNFYERIGYTANTACCACGGGAGGASFTSDQPIASSYTVIDDSDFEPNESTKPFWRINSAEGLREDTNAHSGSWSAVLKKKRKIVSRWIDVSGYTDVQVKFYYRTLGFEGNDNFVVDFKLFGDDGRGFVTVASWDYGLDFDNNGKQWVEAIVTIPTNVANGVGGTKMKIRIGNDSNNGNDRLYVDDVTLSGGVAGSTAVAGEPIKPQTK